MEEKMALTEEKQHESEIEDIRAFKEMKKYYGKDRQVTELTSSPMYRTCCKEVKILFNHTLTSIDKNKKCSCSAASPIWEENLTRELIHTFACDITGTADRGFGRPHRPEYSLKKIQNVIDDPSNISSCLLTQ